jgi:predicted TIM-barrel fold metal-dependent hydrolase
MSRLDITPTVVDIHALHVHPALDFALPPAAPPQVAEMVRSLRPLLSDPEARIEALDREGIDRRVLQAHPSTLDLSGIPKADDVSRVNEHLAVTVAAHPDRLSGFATLNAFEGDASAEAARYAIEELGLAGLVVESYIDGAHFGAPETESTLAVAAELGVPVLVHPTTPPDYQPFFDGLGSAAMVFGRGATNAAALLTVLDRGLLTSLPGLRLIFTELAVGALHFAGVTGVAEELRQVDGRRRGRIYVDTMLFEPASIRYAVDVLGVDGVLVGTDWPLIQPYKTRGEILAVLAAAGLEADEIARVAGGNALELLGLADVAPTDVGATSK